MSQTVSFLIATSLSAYNNLMMRINNTENSSDYIMTCFSIPKLAVINALNEGNKLEGFEGVYILMGGNEYNQPEIYFNYDKRPSSIDNYVPRNQKLLTYPYIYLGLSAPNTSPKIFRYEDFENSTPKFGMISEVNPNPQVCIIPQDYKGVSGNNIANIVSMSGYPTLSSRSDYFNTWLAQNSNLINLQMQNENANYVLNQQATKFNGTARHYSKFTFR